MADELVMGRWLALLVIMGAALSGCSLRYSLKFFEKPFLSEAALPEIKPVDEALPGLYYQRDFTIPAGISNASVTATSLDNRCDVEFSTDGGSTWSTSVSVAGGDTILVRARINDQSTTASTIRIQANNSAVNWDIQPSAYHGFIQSQKSRQSNATIGANERFGRSVSASSDGTRVLVGAYSDSYSGKTEVGSGAILEKSGDRWVQVAFLQQSTPTVNYENMGSMVRLSADGTRAALYATHAQAGTLYTGALFLFWDSGSGWVQQQKIIPLPSEEKTQSEFGNNPSFSSDASILVFTSAKMDGSITSEGAAFVYRYNSSSLQYERIQKILPPDTNSTGFGYDALVSGDGNTLLVSRITDSNSNPSDGSVYVYRKKMDNTYEFVNRVVAPTSWSSQGFGLKLAMNSAGNSIAVSSRKNDAEGDYEGRVFTFKKNSDSTWVALNNFGPPSPSVTGSTYFGTGSLSMDSSGKRLIVGARGGVVDGVQSGSAHVYTRSDDQWTLTQSLSAFDRIANVYFGMDVSISADGNVIAVGASEHTDQGYSRSGAAYIFDQDLPASATSPDGDPGELVPAKVANLVAHASFDFDFSDVGPGANAVGIQNLVTLDASTKKVGAGAARFGTTNSVLTYPSIATTSAVSLSLWYYADGTQLASSRLINADGYRLRLGSNTSTLVFESLRASGNTVTWTSDRNTIQAGRWHHLAVVYGGGLSDTPTIYLNGSQLVLTSSGSALNAVLTGSNFAIGGNPDTSGSDLSVRGVIDEVTVWDAVLSRQEIINLKSQSR